MKHTKLKYWVGNSILLLTLSACGGGGGSSSTETSAPPTPPANVAPSANAGADQTVNEQTQVTLSGSGTDTDGSITSYKWAQTLGTSVSLSNSNSANAGFMAPDVSANETLTFELTVADNDGATAKDSISVVINNVTQSSTGQAALGALSGATIKVARFASPSTVIETVTAQQSLSDTNVAGQFALTLNGVADNEWLIVSASGGQDIDANGDGTADAQPVSNQGTIHALAQASDWKQGGNISMLTEIAYQQAKMRKSRS